MEHLFKSIRQESTKYVLNDTLYFKSIFKKTERICGTVLYLLTELDAKGQNETLGDRLEKKTLETLETAYQSLRGQAGAVYHDTQHLRFLLIELQSLLEMMNYAQIFSREHVAIFAQEIDTLQRSLAPYLSYREDEYTELPVRKDIRTKRASLHAPRDSFEENVVQGMGSTISTRAERILAVIREKQSATIKDISAIVRDCSEKTIQRELIDLIKNSQIQRTGDRRWSKYSLI